MSVLIIECGTLFKICRRCPISFKHMSLRWLSFGCYLTTHPSNIRVQLRKLIEQHMSPAYGRVEFCTYHKPPNARNESQTQMYTMMRMWRAFHECKSQHCRIPFLHTRLRARDHHTSSTLIGGKGGAGPTSLHTMLEGPTEYVNARWM